MNPETAPPLPDRITSQLPPEVRRYRVDVEGIHLHVMESGAGRPVLLVHGNPTWGFLWRKVMAGLAGAPLRCIAPDLAGLGLSDRIPARAHTPENHATWLANLILALDLRDVILVVQDWGGPIGLLAFEEIRDRLGAIVIANTVIGPPRAGFRPTSFHKLAHGWLGRPAFVWGSFPIGVLHTVQGDRSSIQGEVAWAYWWPLRTRALREAPLALARMVPNHLQHPTVPALERVAAIVADWKGPAAIVWGDRDPILGRVRTHVERTLPQAKVWKSESGHFLQEEVPQDFVAAIRHVAGLEVA